MCIGLGQRIYRLFHHSGNRCSNNAAFLDNDDLCENDEVTHT